MLLGKNALITGVSRHAGIGAAIAKAFAHKGVNLVLSYYRLADEDSQLGSKDSQEALEIVEACRALGVKAYGIEIDLSLEASSHTLMAQAIASLGSVDILVNNAAYSINANLMALNSTLLDKHYAVNCRAPVLLSQAFAKQGSWGGRIINLTSGQSFMPMADELPYALSKGCLETFTFNAAPELAAKGITINAVDPGATDTGWMSSDLKKQLQDSNPQGRLATPEDAVNSIIFLASEGAQWVTGQVLRSRGGV